LPRNRLTSAGTRATRRSPGAVSRITPMIVMNAPFLAGPPPSFAYE
jgi:hypothetical protein